MNDEVEQIKDRLDIVDVVSNYLTLKKAGTNLKANCPFHNEKSPSFMVSPERQTFRCFGCNEGGDIFTFIEKMEGVDFYNALKILAERAGVALKSGSVKYGEREFKSDKKTRIYEINDWTKKLYHKILVEHPKAEKARKYIKNRSLKEETVKEFEIGYAPDSWDLLVKFLKGKGYEESEIVHAGVAIKSEKGKVYDRFRGRIIFPINNVMGLTVAFTSRILENNSEQAKYINSSESPVYTKGKTIYGLDKAKMSIKENDLAVFVEGNMDVIACHQAGFKNVVATSGTAITPEQLTILNRYANVIALSFDHDGAGETAMKRAIKIALQNDINTKIISIEGPYKDPDEAIKADPKNWDRAILHSKPSLEYWIDLLIRKTPDLSVLTKKSIAKEILPVIKTIFSDIEKEYYIKYLANKLSVAEKTIIGALEKTKKIEDQNFIKDHTKPAPKLGIVEKILGIIWNDPELIFKCKNVPDIKLDNHDVKDFISMVNDGKIDKEKINSEMASILSQYSMVALKEIDTKDTDMIQSELEYLLSRLHSEEKEDLKSDFAKKIQEAEQSGDKEKVRKLLTEFSNLIK
ncbi:MAG: DNA primase [Patescibacteria group bacterium]